MYTFIDGDVIRSSYARVCVCVRAYACERDCVSHSARSRDRTRAGIISPLRATKFLPFHWSHWNKPTAIRQSSFIRKILRSLFIAGILIFDLWLRRKKILYRNLYHVYYIIHEDLQAEAYFTSSPCYLNVTIIPIDPTRDISRNTFSRNEKKN